MCFHKVFQISFQIIFQILLWTKNNAILKCTVSTIAQSYFLSLIQRWVMYIYMQVRKSAYRSLIYRLQIYFLFKCTYLSRLFHSYRDKPVGRWGKYSSPGKPPDTSASRIWLVSHVTSARLKPSPPKAVG